LIKRKLNRFLLPVVILLLGSSCSDGVDSYQRIIALQRASEISYKSVVAKSPKWKEPLRSALLKEFSQDNLSQILAAILKNYLSENEAAAAVAFFESEAGQKFFNYGYGEIHEDAMTSSDWKKIESFMKSPAGLSYTKFAEQGIVEYHNVLRERTQAIVDRYRNRS